MKRKTSKRNSTKKRSAARIYVIVAETPAGAPLCIRRVPPKKEPKRKWTIDFDAPALFTKREAEGEVLIHFAKYPHGKYSIKTAKQAKTWHKKWLNDMTETEKAKA